MTTTTVGGKYLIRELIGEGGMGSVYEAEHLATKRRCAVKVISSLELVNNAEVVGRFEREARAAGVVTSRHIAQVLDAGVDEDSGLPFIAMEYLDGDDLHGLLDQLGPLPPSLALRIAAQACLGLHKAHEAKIVHRDIKPHNLFLCLEDAGEVVVKVLDFGVAKVKMDQSSTLAGGDLTTPGSLLGSPRYMSPEQARGGRDVDARTDIWSLGAVLYQALCGHSPYHEAETLADLIIALTTKPPPPLRDAAPWVSPDIAEIVDGCLRRDRDERYASAQVMFDAIQPLIDGRWVIHQAMLRPLSEDEQKPAAARLESTQLVEEEAADSSQAEPESEGTADDSSPFSATQPAEVRATIQELTGSGQTGPVSGLGPASVTVVSGEPSPRSRTPLILGVVALLGVSAALIYWLNRPDQPASAAGPRSTTTAAGLPSSSAPGAAASNAAKPSAARSVRVVIIPEEANVEVEGKPVELHDGILMLDGSLGDVYRVRAFQDRSETIADVVISSSGALPPKIEVIANQVRRIPAARPGSSVAPKATVSPVAAPSSAPAKPAAPLPMDRTMDEFE